MSMGPGYGLAASGQGGMRASDADRERAAEVLRTGFAEGRLDKDEYDSLLGQVYSAKTHGELATLTSQLPGGGSTLYAAPVSSPARYAAPAEPTNRLAVASLVCGLSLFFIPLPDLDPGHRVRPHRARPDPPDRGEGRRAGAGRAGARLGRSRADQHRPGGIRGAAQVSLLPRAAGTVKAGHVGGRLR